MKKLLLAGIGFIVLLFSCRHEPVVNPYDKSILESLDKYSPTGNHLYYVFPAADHYSALPNQDPQNPVTPLKVKLGKMLFHETGLGQGASRIFAQETFSCSSCHMASNGFTPGRMQGVADGGIGMGESRELWQPYESTEVDAQGLRPLSVLNVGYMTNTLWSGIFGSFGVNEGTEHLWEPGTLAESNHLNMQALEVQNVEGLKLHRLEVTEKVLDEYGYRRYFDYCFPDIPESERYTDLTASFALGAYLRTLLANRAPFQKWLKGDETAMTEQEKRGATLFLGKARCITCHNSPSFGSMEFHALGTKDMYHYEDALNTSSDDERNLGRGFFTKNPDDYFKFKVPQLYNLKDYTHFFHGSSKRSIREVVEFKIKAQSENENVENNRLSSKFRPVDLTAQEVDDLVAFLENALRDPDLDRYLPEEILSGNCFPNNDPTSRLQAGCD